MNVNFCKDVLKFLKARFGDCYEFNIELSESMNLCSAELKIKSCGLTRIISKCYMNYFYELYHHEEIIQETGKLRWQQELVDIIEGN